MDFLRDTWGAQIRDEVTVSDQRQAIYDEELWKNASWNCNEKIEWNHQKTNKIKKLYSMCCSLQDTV